MYWHFEIYMSLNGLLALSHQRTLTNSGLTIFSQQDHIKKVQEISVCPPAFALIYLCGLLNKHTGRKNNICVYMYYIYSIHNIDMSLFIPLLQEMKFYAYRFGTLRSTRSLQQVYFILMIILPALQKQPLLSLQHSAQGASASLGHRLREH